jgi:hypothetical protein
MSTTLGHASTERPDHQQPNSGEISSGYQSPDVSRLILASMTWCLPNHKPPTCSCSCQSQFAQAAQPSTPRSRTVTSQVTNPYHPYHPNHPNHPNQTSSTIHINLPILRRLPHHWNGRHGSTVLRTGSILTLINAKTQSEMFATCYLCNSDIYKTI